MIKASSVLFATKVAFVSTLCFLVALLCFFHKGVAAQLSFATLGDWGCVPIGGWHEQDQLIVGKQFARAAQEVDAQFILNPGDNFYYCGIESKDAQWWNSTFENVYSEPSLMVPWFNALGNHDYGYPTSVQAQIDYKSPNNNRWVLPDRYYYRRISFPGQVNISLVVLDSSPCQSAYRSNDASGWDPCGSVIPGCPGCTFHENVIAQSCQTQRAWLQSILPTIPEGDWKIAMNHAPAMDIDVDDLISDLQGANFDVYFNGHVHLMAHYTIDNKGTYITSGGGCMVRVPDSEELIPKAEEQAKAQKKGEKVQDPVLLKHLEQGDELMKLRKDVRAANLGATSCTKENPNHNCQLVYQKIVAGYTTHTFSDDFKVLHHYIYDYAGNLLHSANTKKGTGGEPDSSSSGGSAPASNSASSYASSSTSEGGCCYMDQTTSCWAGETCCSESGRPYDEKDCKYYGYKKDCVWDGVDGKCHVRSSQKKN